MEFMNKYYIIDNFEFIKKLTHSENELFFKLCNYQIKNIVKNININDLISKLNISESKFYRNIKKLKSTNMVFVKNNKLEFSIYINPLYIISNDFILSEDMYKIFNDDIFKINKNLLLNIMDSDVFNNNIDSFKSNIDSDLFYKIFIRHSKFEYKIISNQLNECGLYVLYKNQDIVYIGKSKNIKNRLKKHKKDKDFDCVKSIIFKDTNLVNLYEPYLIQKYQPKYNNDLLERFEFELPEIKL